MQADTSPCGDSFDMDLHLPPAELGPSGADRGVPGPDADAIARIDAATYWVSPGRAGLLCVPSMCDAVDAQGTREQPGQARVPAALLEVALRELDDAAFRAQVHGAGLYVALAGSHGTWTREQAQAVYDAFGTILPGQSVTALPRRHASAELLQLRPTVFLHDPRRPDPLAALTVDVTVAREARVLIVEIEPVALAAITPRFGAQFAALVAREAGRLIGLWLRTQVVVDTDRVHALHQDLSEAGLRQLPGPVAAAFVDGLAGATIDVAAQRQARLLADAQLDLPARHFRFLKLSFSHASLYPTPAAAAADRSIPRLRARPRYQARTA